MPASSVNRSFSRSTLATRPRTNSVRCSVVLSGVLMWLEFLGTVMGATGRMDPKLGSTIGYLGTALLRAFEVADFEQRLERLDQRNELE
jgi:hypothetical protein